MSARREICRHLFGEEWIVGDVWLRLLREPVRVVELLSLGEPDDLRQRLLPRPADLRVALRPPRDATGGDGERDDCRRDPRAARRPRPRDRRLLSGRRQPRVTRRGEIAHVGCRDRAPLAVAHERPVDDLLQLRGDIGPQRSDRRERRRQHRLDDRQRVRALERHATRQHLVGDDAERPEIRPCVHRFTGRLFGRHVAGRARLCCPHA